MSAKKRLSKQERKNQICEIALKLFIENGFENTTMKDIQRESGISIGGLYHHYENIYYILKDLIMSLGDNKNNIFSEIKISNSDIGIEEIIIQSSLSMIFDKSENSLLYVHLLIAMKKNDHLKRLYELRKKKSKEEFISMLKYHDALEFKCLANEDFINFFNAAKLGVYYFDDNVEKSGEMYLAFIRNYIKMHT